MEPALTLQRTVQNWKTQPPPRNPAEMQQRIEEMEGFHQVQELTLDTALYNAIQVLMHLPLIKSILGEDRSKEFLRGFGAIQSLTDALEIEMNLQKQLISEAQNNDIAIAEKLIHSEKRQKAIQEATDTKFKLLLTELEAAHMNYLQQEPDLLQSVLDNTIALSSVELSSLTLSSLVPIYRCDSLFDPNTTALLKSINPSNESPADRACNNILILMASQNELTCKESCALVVEAMPSSENLTFSERIDNGANKRPHTEGVHTR